MTTTRDKHDETVGCEADALDVATALVEDGVDFEYNLIGHAGHKFTVNIADRGTLEEIINELK